MTIYTKLEDNLTKLKLTAIKEYLPSYLEGNDLSLPEILEQLTSKELAYRTQRSAKMSIHVAHFPYAKGLDEFDFDFQPSVDKQRIMNLASINFISSAKNILFIGSSGVGKTHLATGLGMEACKNHLSTYFVNCHELIERLKLAHQENRLAAILKNYSRYKLLIIDEIGYLPIDDLGSDLFFQLIARRYEKKSTIITTNIPLSEWGETFSNPTIANAILDRLVHHSEIFKITGKSYRMKDYQEHTKTQK
ncbi:IS21-like element helper ATPase IstB [Limosilactobacillus coleohominis]|uniref:ATP-binding protein n=1 Tax=Limosilactobacillus coleohominis TaxID=181675 RepID=A0ABS2GZ38_9LACO|nr:IS21-like element helper ATPase IstB [Limosilactobacillus coleohominis]MBM6940639.1 ATP-binding protein [Limosilactobacillus coleohominis]